jgi:4-hydroxy-3-methylbut-2-enyl diphosphate reductase
VLAPLSIEALALRLGLREARVVRTGWGARRARAAAQRLCASEDRALAVAGFCGALDTALVPGDVVVASELLGGPGARKLADVDILVAALRALGERAHFGPILSLDHIVRGRERDHLREGGAIAVDMESRWLAEAARGRSFAVLRVVVDTPTRELLRIGALLDGLRALATLRRVAPALETWSLELARLR